MPLLSAPPEPMALEAYVQQAPSATSTFFLLHHMPEPNLAEDIGRQMDRVVHAVFDWFDYGQAVDRAPVVILSPEEPEGQTWLNHYAPDRQQNGGVTRPDNTLIVVGHLDDPRLQTILRHEAAHYAMHRLTGNQVPLPFWLDEGVACLFEMGVDANNKPLPNPERRDLLRYLVHQRRSLHLERLIRKPSAQPTGQDYARAWGMAATLYHQGRSPQAYLATLSVPGDQPLARFEKNLLGPNEHIKDFEIAIENWIKP